MEQEKDRQIEKVSGRSEKLNEKKGDMTFFHTINSKNSL